MHGRINIAETTVEQRVHSNFEVFRSIKVVPNQSHAASMVYRTIVTWAANGESPNDALLPVILGKYQWLAGRGVGDDGGYNHLLLRLVAGIPRGTAKMWRGVARVVENRGSRQS